PPGSNKNHWCEGDSLAKIDASHDATTAQFHAVHAGGANSAHCMHTYKGIGTQRSDGCKETQGGLHSQERNDGWK
ncbi:hypothetical protein PAXRUDRAFT_167214, partial [Paxillus rubicundulus Ve08.2h10]